MGKKSKSIILKLLSMFTYCAVAFGSFRHCLCCSIRIIDRHALKIQKIDSIKLIVKLTKVFNSIKRPEQKQKQFTSSNLNRLMKPKILN